MKICKMLIIILCINNFFSFTEASQKISLNNLFNQLQKDDKALLRRLHIKDGEKVIGGAEAFLLVWKKIPKYKFLYTFFKIPIIFTLFSYFYEIIAFFLYLKNKKQLSK